MVLPARSYHVPSLAGRGVPHQTSTSLQTYFQMFSISCIHTVQGPSKQMDLSDTLRSSGIVVPGEIPQSLTEKVKRNLPTLAVKQRHFRWTELDWNDECGVVRDYYDSVSRVTTWKVSTNCSDLGILALETDHASVHEQKMSEVATRPLS